MRLCADSCAYSIPPCFFLYARDTTEMYTLSLQTLFRSLAKRILQEMAQPFDLGEQKAFAGMSIGIALHPHDAKDRSEEHTSELQSRQYLVCRLLLEKKTTKPSWDARTRTPSPASDLE